MADVRRLACPVAAPPRPTRFGAGDVTVTDRFIAVDGAPVFPVTGEIHYSRVPRAGWHDSLRRLRAGGATHVTTYVLWNHHEPVRGDVSFDGDLDLRAFLRLAEAEGLGIVLRIGPYAHAEARHGGIPDWLVASGVALRTNDPDYLAEAERCYSILAEQTRGIDVFAIQADNELYDRPEHLTRLRRIAESVGFSAPLWTATAWGGADVPDDALPVFGGYPESFWIEASEQRDERSASNFYPSPRRDDDSIGADHRGGVAVAPARSYDAPFATCELGSGMTAAYHRRPVVTGRDVEAIALAKLASGSVWQGYYMYSDGRNPRRGLQESHAVGEPNDFPELSYDFAAPLTVDAAPRESWYRLRRQHSFLAQWGSALAAMPALFPHDAPDVPDVTGLRWAVRGDGASGFLFVVNHQPGVTLPPHREVVFEIATGEGGTVTFPEAAIPSGAAFLWPFGLRAGEATIRWATAQPLTEVHWRGAPLLVLAETAAIPARFDADCRVRPLTVDGPGVWSELVRDDVVLARVVVLTEDEGLALGAAGSTLVLASGIVTKDSVEVFTAAGAAGALAGVWQLTDAGWHQLADAPAPHVWSVEVTPQRAAGMPPEPVAAPNGRASLPQDWAGAARIDLAVPGDADGTLVIAWEGDVARLWDGDRLVSDALYRGEPWRISAAERGEARTLRVEILPLHPDAAVSVGGPTPTAAAVHAARIEQPSVLPVPVPVPVSPTASEA